MKKLIFLLTILLALTIQGQAQRLSNTPANIVIFTDTTTLTGGEEFIRIVYGFLPQHFGAGNYYFTYCKLYKMNDEEIFRTEPTYQAGTNDSLLLFGQMRTFDWIFPQVVSVDSTNWQTASWQVFLQKIYSPGAP